MPATVRSVGAPFQPSGVGVSYTNNALVGVTLRIRVSSRPVEKYPPDRGGSPTGAAVGRGAPERDVLRRAGAGHLSRGSPVASARKSRAGGQDILSVPPSGTAAQRCSRSRTPRMARAIVSSSTRASRLSSDGSFSRVTRPRTPAAVSGPSPHRLVTQFAMVLARRYPGVSHSPVRAPVAAPETIRPCLRRLGSRAVAARPAAAWYPGGKFCPQPVGDAEQGLDDQMRKVVGDVNGAAPCDPADGQPGTVLGARPGGLDQGYLHHQPTHPGTTRMP